MQIRDFSVPLFTKNLKLDKNNKKQVTKVLKKKKIIGRELQQQTSDFFRVSSIATDFILSYKSRLSHPF